MKTNFTLPVLIIILVIVLVMILVAMFLFVNRATKTRFKLQLEKLENEKKLFKLFYEIFSKEKELTINRVSCELHDNVCSILDQISRDLTLYSLSLNSNKNAEITNALQSSIELSSHVRELSHLLNADLANNHDLYYLVRKLVESCRKNQNNQKITFDYLIVGTAFPLNKNIELLVFRTIQEFLANAIKHANATYIEISLSYADTYLCVNVYDNGVGFDLETVALGLGLSSLRNREILINGKIKIESSNQLGTTITITVPYSALPINLLSDFDVAELQQRINS